MALGRACGAPLAGDYGPRFGTIEILRFAQGSRGGRRRCPNVNWGLNPAGRPPATRAPRHPELTERISTAPQRVTLLHLTDGPRAADNPHALPRPRHNPLSFTPAGLPRVPDVVVFPGDPASRC